MYNTVFIFINGNEILRIYVNLVKNKHVSVDGGFISFK